MAETETKDYYQILGVFPFVSPEELREAYRRLAFEIHPDRLPPDTAPEIRLQQEEDFKTLGEAYSVLKDPERRQKYDSDRYGFSYAIPVSPKPEPSPSVESVAPEPAVPAAVVVDFQDFQDFRTPPTQPPRPSTRVKVTPLRGKSLPPGWEKIGIPLALMVIITGAVSLFYYDQTSPKPPTPTPVQPLRSRTSASTSPRTTPRREPPPAPRRTPRREGTVVVRAFLAADNTIVKVQILRTSGYTKIDRAARDSVLQAMSIPPKRGKIVRKVDIPMRYQLTSGGFLLYDR